MTTKRVLEIGGFVSAAIMVAFGVAVILLAVNGRSTVNSSLKQEKITGTPDMTPAAIKAEAAKAGLTGITFPTCTVAGKAVVDGATARCFAEYMRIHTLEATHGFVYAEMGRYEAKPGTPKAQLTPDGATNNPAYAVVDPTTKQPVANAARDIWVTETALTTALNDSYMADQLSLFSLVIGIALLLAGIGFAVLDWAAIHGRRPEPAAAAEDARATRPTKPAIA